MASCGDQIGLLSPSHRTESGHRLYDRDDVVRLQQIVMLRQLGFRDNKRVFRVDQCGAGFNPRKAGFNPRSADLPGSAG